MSDLAYVHTKPCGCVSSVTMIDDENPEDLRRHADIYALAKRCLRTTDTEVA